MVKIKNARLGLSREVVEEAVNNWNGQNVAQPQQTETPEAMPQNTTAVPQNTNTETQSSNDAYNDYLRRKSRGYVDNTLTPETVEETQTTSPIDVKKLEEEVVANSANTFGTTAPKSGVDYLDSLYEELKPISKEEEERRLRGAASANTVAHLGNLLGALGGLYYTTKGAPAQKIADIKNPDYDAFSERVRKQREAHAGRLRDLDKWKQQMRLAEDELALKKQNAAYERELNALKLQLEQGKLSAQQYEIEIKKLEAEFLQKKQEAELGRINAQTGSYNSSAYASRKRGDHYANGGSGGDDKIPVWDEDGNLHYFDNYKAAEAFGLANRTWRYDEYDEVSTTETPTRMGTETSTRTTQKRGKGYSVNPKGDEEGLFIGGNSNNSSNNKSVYK